MFPFSGSTTNPPIGREVGSPQAQPRPVKTCNLLLGLSLETLLMKYNYHVPYSTVEAKSEMSLPSSLSVTFLRLSLLHQPCSKASEEIRDAEDKSKVTVSMARSCPLL